MLASHELRGVSAVYSQRRPSEGGLPKRAALFESRRPRKGKRVASDDELGPEPGSAEPEPEDILSPALEPTPELATPHPDALLLSEWGGVAVPVATVSEKEARKAELLQKLTAAVMETFSSLEGDGIPWIQANQLKIGPELSRGAFGIVRSASMGLHGQGEGWVEVAVKTLSTGHKASARVLENFATEVRMAWRACWKARAGKHTSRILYQYGISFDFTKRNRARLHIVMEKLNCSGDLHDEIHSESHWVCLRDEGVDTGASVRNHYITVDGHDVKAPALDPIRVLSRVRIDFTGVPGLGLHHASGYQTADGSRLSARIARNATRPNRSL